MAKVRLEPSIKLDVLGKWQLPILDAIKADMPGSQATYMALPMGRAGLVVYWKGFHGHDITERQDMLRSTIAKLGAAVSKRVSLLIALTPEEDSGLNTF